MPYRLLTDSKIELVAKKLLKEPERRIHGAMVWIGRPLATLLIFLGAAGWHYVLIPLIFGL